MRCWKSWVPQVRRHSWEPLLIFQGGNRPRQHEFVLFPVCWTFRVPKVMISPSLNLHPWRPPGSAWSFATVHHFHQPYLSTPFRSPEAAPYTMIGVRFLFYFWSLLRLRLDLCIPGCSEWPMEEDLQHLFLSFLSLFFVSNWRDRK